VKLRIKGNSLRLRVTRSELDRLLAGEPIEEAIHFSPAPESALRYVLRVDPVSKGTHISYIDGEIDVSVSSEQARVWNEETQVGIYTTLDLSSAGALKIAIEKDFACLDGRDEDNHDTFANPLEGKAC
jgi:hypothetical protein